MSCKYGFLPLNLKWHFFTLPYSLKINCVSFCELIKLMMAMLVTFSRPSLQIVNIFF